MRFVGPKENQGWNKIFVIVKNEIFQKVPTKNSKKYFAVYCIWFYFSFPPKSKKRCSRNFRTRYFFLAMFHIGKEINHSAAFLKSADKKLGS